MVGARALAIAGLFAVAAPIHLAMKVAGRHRAVPPRFLHAVGWLAGLRVRVEGRRARSARLLLVANHVSWLDILAMAGASGCGFVARGNLADHPVLRWLCEQNDTLFVSRERRGSVGEQVVRIRSALAARPMTVFAEGTTGDGRALLPFKSSLLSAAEDAPEAAADDPAVTVQPVALAYRHPSAIAWTGNEPGAANVLRVLARVRPVRLTALFLEPLSGEERSGRKEMAAAAQERIGSALGLSPGSASHSLPKGGPIA